MFRMTTDVLPATTLAVRVGYTDCAPLKCPSPVTVAAALIARQHGVLTDLQVGSGSEGGPPSRRVEDGTGKLLVFNQEKENIDPVNGLHARLASGTVASGTGTWPWRFRTCHPFQTTTFFQTDRSPNSTRRRHFVRFSVRKN